MSDIVITRSRRGLFNVEEWETFAGVNGAGPIDTRVFFRCREPSCWRIWTMYQEAYRVIDIEQNPIQCAECGSYNITATWCNVKERPYTIVGIPNGAADGTSAWAAGEWKTYHTTLKTFRDRNGGQDPTPADAEAYAALQWIKSYMYIKYPPEQTAYSEYIDTDEDGDKELTNVPYPYSTKQYFEVFHQYLPNIKDPHFWNADGKITEMKDKLVATPLPARTYKPTNNYNFYRCIINMVIQTEFTGSTGGSA